MRIVLFVILLWAARLSAAAAVVPTDGEIRSILQNFIKRDHWGIGIVVGLVDERGTRIISYGKLDNGDSAEVNGDTLFEIGSVTKTFTTLLLQDMIERGEMKWNDPVEKFLPASVKVEDPAWGVVKHLRVKFRAGGKIQTAEVKEGETLRLTAGAEVVEAVYGNLPVANQTVDVTQKIVAFTKNGELNVKADSALGVHEVPLKVPSWDARKITLLDLATHSSGLPRELNELTVAGLYDFLSHHGLGRRPGRKVEYSNLGFLLLGQAIALRAGTNYDALLQERICRPLNMDSTCIKPTAELQQRWAKSHAHENRVAGDLGEASQELPAAGAIRSSANDMLKYVAANLGLTNSPLTRLMEQSQVARIRRAFDEADLALPWWVYHRDGAELITHGGSTWGQQAFIGFDRKQKRGVVLMANRKDGFNQALFPLGMYLLHPPSKKPVPVQLAPEILDSYEGLYEFPNLSQAILSIRRGGDRLIVQFLNAVSHEWLAQSDTEFAHPWNESRLKLTRSVGGRMTATFTSPNARTWRARKISDVVPESLFLPVPQPLSASECAPRMDSDLQGTWEGTARLWFLPCYSVHGNVRIAEPAPGTFRAEFEYENQPLAVIYHPPGVELVIRSGAGMFKGRINADHTKMTGHWIQGHWSAGVTLRRADPERDAPPATPPAKQASTN